MALEISCRPVETIAPESSLFDISAIRQPGKCSCRNLWLRWFLSRFHLPGQESDKFSPETQFTSTACGQACASRCIRSISHSSRVRTSLQGDNAMSAAHALISMDPPASLNRIPLFEAIRKLAGMAGNSAHTDGVNDGHDDSSVAVLVDTEVDGARYLLVRMPKLERQDPHKHPVRSQPRHSADGSPSERRQRFGGSSTRSGCRWR